MYGEVSERFKEPVLKTGDAATHHGFESHPLRQTENALETISRAFLLYLSYQSNFLKQSS